MTKAGSQNNADEFSNYSDEDLDREINRLQKVAMLQNLRKTTKQGTWEDIVKPLLLGAMLMGFGVFLAVIMDRFL